MIFRLATAILLIFSATGCLIPIPHRRIHAYGVRGQIVDQATGESIENAWIAADVDSNPQASAVRSDATGRFKIAPIERWHGAYFISPIRLSLFPAFDFAGYGRLIRVQARGYDTSDLRISGHVGDQKGEWILPGETDASVSGAYLDTGKLSLARSIQDHPADGKILGFGSQEFE